LPLDEKPDSDFRFTVFIPHSVATEESSLYVVITPIREVIFLWKK